MSDQPHKFKLDVLPNSNKAEQMRAEFAAQRPPQPAGDTNSAVRTRVNDAPDQSLDQSLDESLSPAQRALRERVIDALKTVYDPELPVNIFDLGLIYAVKVDEQNAVQVTMTLTAPGCPVAGTLPGEIQRKIAGIDGISAAKVELVWDPPWDKSRMSEVAMLELGFL